MVPTLSSALPTIRECTPVCGHLGVYRELAHFICRNHFDATVFAL